ncbi:hypothetical protein B0I35DRAFT_483565 [Stachybotrys elegans]|uniref:Uncharacterized protein n=1 Tax=Stachybotrys elegans TaxID=80388 RepID=A0A8K0WKN6_9HYPO|nr:hypothetical protein B0I35DRAFT_483565 [Stachybotrys elegans]
MKRAAATILESEGIKEPPTYEKGLLGGTSEFLWHIRVVESTIGYDKYKRLTLLIETEWEDGCADSWEKTVWELKHMVDDKFPEFDMEVEIISTHLTRFQYFGAIIDQPELETAWKGIDSEVVGIINRNARARGTMVMVSLDRIGHNPIRQDNPIGVFIALDYACPEEEFSHIAADVDSLMASLSLPDPVTVHIEYNQIHHFEFFD